MRYCNKTKSVIKSSYLSASIEEIQKLIVFAGLRWRSEESVEKYVNELKEKDRKKEVKRLKLKKWALANPIKYRARTLTSGAQQRAKNVGNEFNLTKEWVEQKLRDGKCEITGIDFFIKPYSSKSEYKRVHPHSPSLDQIDPGKGYTLDNVQVVCDQVNKFKGDRHVTSMVKVAKEFLNEYNRRNTPLIKAK